MFFPVPLIGVLVPSSRLMQIPNMAFFVCLFICRFSPRFGGAEVSGVGALQPAGHGCEEAGPDSELWEGKLTITHRD